VADLGAYLVQYFKARSLVERNETSLLGYTDGIETTFLNDPKWPVFPLPTGQEQGAPGRCERQVTAQTRNFSQTLYNHPLNEKEGPGAEAQDFGLQVRFVLEIVI